MPAAPNLLEQALALDRAGKELAAIPLYRKALAGTLSPEDLHTALVCLASSLRTTGNLKAALRTLQKCNRLFPRDPTVILFLALVHADLGQYPLAIRQLADGFLKESRNPRLSAYRTALAKKFHAFRPIQSRTKRKP